MSSKNNRIRRVRTRSDLGHRFKPTLVAGKGPLSGYGPLADLPDFDPGLPSKKLRVLFDEDAAVLEGLLEDLGFRTASVVGTSLAGKSDEDIARAAYKQNRILITFNHNDFFYDNRSVPITNGGCPGIIAIKGSNNAPGGAIAAAQMVEQILIQIGLGVRLSWWTQTKLSVTGEKILLKKLVNGTLHKFVLETDSRGLLWARKTKQKI